MKKIWHPWYKWECYKAGFYSNCRDIGMTKHNAKEQYRLFLSDLDLFESILKQAITKWEYSCEHFLTDKNRNRIAWLGQASMAFYKNIPAEARGGYKLLTNKQQQEADKLALKYLKIWENANQNK
jgi:hypothetical protein